MSLAVRIFRSDRSCLLLLFLLGLALFATSLGAHDLWAPDEPDIGEDGGCPYRFQPESYVHYYRHTAAAIRRADPAAKAGNAASKFVERPEGNLLPQASASMQAAPQASGSAAPSATTIEPADDSQTCRRFAPAAGSGAARAQSHPPERQ